MSRNIAQQILKRQEAIDRAMFQKIGPIVHRPLSTEALRQFERTGNIYVPTQDGNPLSELQLAKILKDNDIVLPSGVRADSPEGTVFIKRRLGEISQQTGKNIRTLSDLVNNRDQIEERLENANSDMMSELENISTNTFETYILKMKRAEDRNRARAESEEEKKEIILDKNRIINDTSIIIRDENQLDKLSIEELKEYAKNRNLSDISTYTERKKARVINQIIKDQLSQSR